MRAMIAALVLLGWLLGVGAGPARAVELAEGMAAPDMAFTDAEGRVHRLEQWRGRVLLVNYTDPDEADLNEHFTDAMKQAKDQGRLRDERYKGIGIADCEATWKPNLLIRAIAGQKAKKYNTVILFDEQAALRRAWGLARDTANAVLLDRQGICRAIVRGRVPDADVARIVDLAVALQEQ
jgi:predicted transcriptional regulator